MLIRNRKSNLSGWPGDMFESWGFKGAGDIQINGTGDFFNFLFAPVNTVLLASGQNTWDFNRAKIENVGQVIFPMTLLMEAQGITAIDQIPVISDIMKWSEQQGIVENWDLQASPEIRKYTGLILDGLTAVAGLVNPVLGGAVGAVALSWDQFGASYDLRIADKTIDEALNQTNADLAYLDQAAKEMNAEQLERMKAARDKIEGAKLSLVFKKYIPLVAGVGIIGSLIS